ncbi:hypothetical protein LPJ72_006345 [Coemansia sp. Benny D160-2]|nr:hypothetical protein LPJ72_006345 [Coemansia sp. Benny D160-2]
MGNPNEQNAQRRRAPVTTPLDKRIQQGYKGKLIKQRIERTKFSNVRRKYFKMLEGDAQPRNQSGSGAKTETAGNDVGGVARNHGDDDNGDDDTEDGHSSQHRSPAKRRIFQAGFSSDPQPSKRTPRANPFKDILKTKELAQQKRDADRRKREEEIRLANKRRSNYMHDRKQQRKSLNARTSRGQPIMSNQISSLLTKIRKNI